MNHDKNSFWNITAQGREANIDLFGVIGDLGMWEESNTAGDFIRELRGLGKNISTLNVNIHSEGGSVWDGLAIYRALVDFQGEKVVHVSALAASIASVIMLAGDRIEVAPEAIVMIHNPMAIAMGGEKDMLDAVARLKSAKDRILNIYERRTGSDRDQLSDLMDAETWFSGGDEIKAAGFADTIKKDQPKMRVAAGPLKLAAHWRHAPDCVVKRKPQPLSPELAARAQKLGIFDGK